MNTTGRGTKTEDFKKMLYSLKDVEVQYDDAPDAASIRAALERGELVVLDEGHREGEALVYHLFVVAAYDKRSNSFLCVNIGRRSDWYSQARFEDMFLVKYPGVPVAWYVRKNP